MAEELGFDQLLGNRRAVHLHEPLAAAQAVAVNRPRDELLADAALAGDEHRGVGGRGAADGGHHVLQPRALADHLMADLDGLLQHAVLVAQLPRIERVAEADEHALARERLLDEIERALFRRFDGGADRSVARHDDDRERVVDVAQPLEDLDAIHAGHLHVEQHEIGSFALGERESFLAGGGADHVVALVLERHLQRVADRRLIVDYEDARFRHVAGAGGGCDQAARRGVRTLAIDPRRGSSSADADRGPARRCTA